MGDAYRKGNLLFQQGRYKLAIEQFQFELQEFPESAVAHSMLALALKNANQKQAAMAAAQQGIRLDPGLAFAHYALGWTTLENPIAQRKFRLAKSPQAIRRKQARLALVHALKALELEPHNVEFSWFVAALHFDSGKPFEALRQIARGLAIEPTYVKLHLLRIICLRRLLLHRRALTAVETALHIDPTEADLHRHRGWLLLATAQPILARESFLRSLQLDAVSADAQKGLRWTRQARRPLVGKRLVQVGVTIYAGNGRHFGVIAVASVICPTVVPWVAIAAYWTRRGVFSYRFGRLNGQLNNGSINSPD